MSVDFTSSNDFVGLSITIIETVLDDNQRRICGDIMNGIDGWIGPPYLHHRWTDADGRWMDELLIGGRRRSRCVRLNAVEAATKRAKQFPTGSNVGTPYKESEYSTCKVRVVQPDSATPDRPSRHIKVV
jgi:hypothetical protein